MTTYQKNIADLESSLATARAELAILQDKTEYEANQTNVLSTNLTTLQADYSSLQNKFTQLRTESEKRVWDLTRERGVHLKELAQARMRSQDVEETLASAREQIKRHAEVLDGLRADKERDLKERMGEAERVLRDHVAEADGFVRSLSSSPVSN